MYIVHGLLICSRIKKAKAEDKKCHLQLVLYSLIKVNLLSGENKKNLFFFLREDAGLDFEGGLGKRWACIGSAGRPGRASRVACDESGVCAGLGCCSQ